jgi:hypothetical protein
MQKINSIMNEGENGLSDCDAFYIASKYTWYFKPVRNENPFRWHCKTIHNYFVMTS